jgi:hypothetical protein
MSPRRSCSSTPRGPRRTPGHGGSPPCCRRPTPPSGRHSRRTAAHLPGGSAAWSATAVAASRRTARRTGCTRSRRAGPRGTPATAASTSRRPGAARDEDAPSPAPPCAACPVPSPHRRTAALPAPHRSVPAATARQAQPPPLALRTRLQCCVPRLYCAQSPDRSGRPPSAAISL